MCNKNFNIMCHHHFVYYSKNISTTLQFPPLCSVYLNFKAISTFFLKIFRVVFISSPLR